MLVVRLSCMGLLAWLCAGVLAAAERPNFVWLISEDNSKHYLQLFDAHGVETPRIAELAREGLVFDHAFSNSPVCSVARTTLITGCYAPRIGTQFHRRSVAVPLPDQVRMFPADLRAAGYYTTNNVKKDYNAVESAGLWDESSREASWRGRAAGQPFFHQQSFPVSHESSLHFTADMMRTQRTQTDPQSVFVAPYHPATPTFRYTYARYHDRIRDMDRQVGAVIDQLRTDGLLEDTFVFYFGDHGGVLPRGKGYIYESGLHVPLVVRIPDKWRHLVDAPRGSRVAGFVSFIDFGPTLLHLAGVPVSDALDGRPFLGAGVAMTEVNQRDETWGYADRFDEKYDLVRSLRKGKFKYLRSYQPFNVDALHNNYRYNMLAYREWRDLYRAGELNPTQSQFFERRTAEALFDVESDPHEIHNLATDPAYATILSDLRSRLTKHVKSLPDLSFYPESHLVEAAFDHPVAFGQSHREEIARLVDIANLSLLPFDEARTRIAQALAAEDRWQRYWGLIACSSHGSAALAMVETIEALAASDPERLVRVRAAEFLGLVGAADPRPEILRCLSETTSATEATLILNTVVLLRDGQPGYDFAVTWHDLPKLSRQNADGVERRLAYLNAPTPPGE